MTHNCRLKYRQRPDWRFIVQEQAAPYAAAIFTLDNESLAYCDELATWAVAVSLWAQCMAERRVARLPGRRARRGDARVAAGEGESE